MSDEQQAVQQDTSAAPAVSEAGEQQNPASDQASTTQSATVAAGTASDASQSSEAAPARDSLIARMHAKIDALEAKIASGVVVFAHEVAEIREHIKAVL